MIIVFIKVLQIKKFFSKKKAKKINFFKVDIIYIKGLMGR
jgi:hypothetical protein